MINLTVLTCGTDYKHAKDFTFTDSDCMFKDCYVFAFFKTDFISMTKNGIQEGNAYSYILHKPFSKIYHTNTSEAETGFTDDWMYIKGDYIDHLVEYMSIPTDTIVPVQNKTFITKIIGKIQIELCENLPFKNERIYSLITDLFIGLSRNNTFQHISIQNHNEFTAISNLRKAVQKDFKKKWSLHSMAQLSCYSTSYFSSLYKRYYQKSPIDDLIDYRINQAKFMLESNAMSFSEIAIECGFNTLYYFSRLFKRRTGLTPTEYRQQFLDTYNDY